MQNRIVNAMYNTRGAAQFFQRHHPDERVLAVGGAKWLEASAGTPLSLDSGWLFAKREVLILSDKRLKCGKLDLAIEDVVSATYLPVRGLLGKGMLIEVTTKGGHVHRFGLQDDPAWLDQHALPLTPMTDPPSFHPVRRLVFAVSMSALTYYVLTTFMR